MNLKKIALVGMCLLIITTSITVLMVKADGTEDEIIDINGVSSDLVYLYPTMGCINYNNGCAIGSFVNFKIDEISGTITDYTVKLTLYPMTWYSSLSSIAPYPEKEYNSYEITYENKTIFNSIKINNFEPQAIPNAFADYLIFLGKNIIMKFFDQEGGSINFASSNKNTKIIFDVPQGFEITKLSDQIYYDVPVKEEDGRETTEKEIPEQPTETVSSPWQTIWIKSNNTTTSISCYNATVNIIEQTIEIELSPYAYLDIYTWIEYPTPPVVNDFWYEDLDIKQEQIIIEDAKNNGIISAEGWVTNDPILAPSADEQSTEWDQIKMANAASNNYYTYDDPTFEMTFNNIDKNGVDVVVNSQISTGRIVIINVDKEVVQTSSIKEFIVSIDDSQIDEVTALEDLMKKVENKDTIGAYFALSGEQLTTVFVYIPHFSTHTISIKTLTSKITAVSNVILPIILSVLLICLFVVGIIIKKRKQQDDF